MSPNLTGALLMVASMAAFTISDTFIKLTGGDIPLFQFLFLRGVPASLFVLILAWRLGALRVRLPRRDIGLVALRSGAEFITAYFFLNALFHLPLANVTAVLQMLPLTVTMGAALFFGERVGWRRWSAIGVGFVGMLLIVQPGTAGFSAWSLYAVAAVLCITVRDLSTRRLSAEVPSMFVTCSAAITVTTGAGIASLGVSWVPVSPINWIYILCSALFILGGYLFSIMVMRVGEIGFIAPFRYTSLVWALVLGWLIFDEWPTQIVLFGAAIVVATGLFTLYRETRSRRKDAADMV